MGNRSEFPLKGMKLIQPIHRKAVPHQSQPPIEPTTCEFRFLLLLLLIGFRFCFLELFHELRLEKANKPLSLRPIQLGETLLRQQPELMEQFSIFHEDWVEQVPLQQRPRTRTKYPDKV